MIPIKPVFDTKSTSSGAGHSTGPDDVSATAATDAEAFGASPAQAALAFLKPGNLHLNALPPLSLYVHFPWCVKKCPYCDFNSHEWKGQTFPEDRYLDALRADLERALPMVWGRQVHTIFIGGGEPSFL